MANKIAKFTAAGTLGSSLMTDNGVSIGINNASPSASYELDVTGDTHVTGNLKVDGFINSSGVAGSINAANVSAGTFGSAVGNGNFSFNGSVGIGTTAPGYKLDVNGDLRVTGTMYGNATSATTATYISSPDGDRSAATKLPTSNARAVRFDFVQAGTTNGGGNYSGLMTYAPWDGTSASTGDASYQLAFNSPGANASGVPYLSIRNGINSTWNSWYNILNSGNYNSYAPSLTGGGASGTWGINITGSAGNADTVDGIHAS